MTVKENYTVKPEYENHVCCICSKTFTGWGNNPEGAAWKTETGEVIQPTFKLEDRCCDECNSKYVIPGRMYSLFIIKENKMDRGERLAIFFTLIFHGECGPLGGEDPILDENTMTLHSQAGDTSYRFNDDDSVDVYMHKNAWEEYLEELDIDPEEDDIPEEILEQRSVHYEHVRDLLHSSDGWFLYIEPEVIEKVLEDYI